MFDRGSQKSLGWSLDQRDPQFIRSLMPFWEWAYTHYFRVQTSGWEQVPEEPVLFVGSHNGGLAAPDMHMMMYDWFRHFGVDRVAYGLMHIRVTEVLPPLAEIAVKTGAVVAHPRMAIAAFQRKASVLVYPGGAQDVFRPYTQRRNIHLAGNTAFIKLALRQEVPIVPAISWGAHDTLLVLAEIYDQMRKLNQLGMPWLFGQDPIVFPIYLGLPWGLSFGPLPNWPLPVQIHTRVLSPIKFRWYGREAACDRAYVAKCYETVRQQMQQGLDDLIAEVGG